MNKTSRKQNIGNTPKNDKGHARLGYYHKLMYFNGYQ